MHLRLAILIAAVLGAPAALAAGESDPRAELAKVQARIKKVTETVHAEAATRDEAAKALKSADESLHEARARLEDVRHKRAAAEARENELKAQCDAARQTLSGERASLASDLRSSYRNGRAESLKLWLNADDPVELGRLMSYYGYFGRARAARIQKVEDDLGRLNALEAALKAEADELASLAREQETEVSALNGARTSREHALATVEADLDSKSTELAKLKSNAASLEKLLAQLREALKDVPAEDYAGAGGHRQPFAQLRGRLPWPARGSVVANFGSAKPGGLVWQGLLLDTEPGTTVRAPYYGRVVYSDWLPGLGLLLILDHGGGYLTLYGNNERLYHKVGDAVAPGDVLASSSAVPATMAAQVYFEVRHGKDAEDPRRWLRPAGQRN